MAVRGLRISRLHDDMGAEQRLRQDCVGFDFRGGRNGNSGRLEAGELLELRNGRSRIDLAADRLEVEQIAGRENQCGSPAGPAAGDRGRKIVRGDEDLDVGRKLVNLRAMASKSRMSWKPGVWTRTR